MLKYIAAAMMIAGISGCTTPTPVLKPVPAPRADLWTDVRAQESRLHPGSSDLSIACFLFQGFADGVMGHHFVYSSKEGKSGEDFLYSILEAGYLKDNLDRRALQYLCGHAFFASHSPQAYLAKGEEQKALREALVNEVHRMPAGSPKWLLEQTMICYLGLSEGRAFDAVVQLHFATGPLARKVTTNVDRVLKQMKVADHPKDTWVRPTFLR